ncbi:MAG: hypothetical protein AABX01_01170 [Candidatus Micrarchaeota archaeon]
MPNFYFIKTRLKNKEIISSIKEYKAISIRPDLASLKGFISAALLAAKADFSRHENVANDFAVQWICRIACKRNINQALDFVMPKGDVVGIASENPLPKSVLSKMGLPIKYSNSKTALQNIASEYSIPPKALEKYGLEDLLIEKSIVSMLE